jgi:hypothetical protein
MRKKTLQRWQAGAALGALAAGGMALQQFRRHAQHGWGRATPYGKLFDPSRIETIRGQVARVARFVPMPGMSEGIELLLDTSNGLAAVHLGPSRFISFEQTGIDPGDALEVTGAKVELAGETVWLATHMRKGDQHIELRTERGVPLWRGARARLARKTRGRLSLRG